MRYLYSTPPPPVIRNLVNKKRDPRRNTVLFFLRLRNETLGSSLQGNKYDIIGGRDIRNHSRPSCLMLFLMCSFKEALEIRKSPRPLARARTFLSPGDVQVQSIKTAKQTVRAPPKCQTTTVCTIFDARVTKYYINAIYTI